MQGVQLRSKTNRGKRNIVSNLKKRTFKKTLKRVYGVGNFEKSIFIGSCSRKFRVQRHQIKYITLLLTPPPTLPLPPHPTSAATTQINQDPLNLTIEVQI